MSRGSFAPRSIGFASLAVAVCLLTACGGGGGGGGGTGSNPDEDPPAAIAPTLTVTADNAQPVAADALNAVTGQNPALTGTGVITGVQVQQDPVSVLGGPARLAALAQTLLKAGGPTLAAGVEIDEPGQCTNLGGTLHFRGTVRDVDALSARDTITIEANNCATVTGPTTALLSGSMTLTVVEGSSTGSHLVMTLTASNLSVESLGVTSTSNGDMKLDITVASASSTTVITGKALTNSVSGPGGSRSSTMRNYRIVQTALGDTQTRSDVTASIESSNARIDGGTVVYTLTTPQAVTTDLGLVLGGSIKVTGVDSSLLLTVTAINNFSLQVDENGDGVMDGTSTTNLAALQNLL